MQLALTEDLRHQRSASRPEAIQYVLCPLGNIGI
jgi:hypothetical protein